ncbi:MAG: hypothetical protein NTV70_04105 [Acidobacteria bacterium]|nr:hypothetical protein [Acidobacteriota bacterium]
MDFLLHRYRSLTVLVVTILAQLVLLAYQVKTGGDVRLIRVWSVEAVTPLARVLEGIRSSTSDFFSNYVVLSGVQAENRRMREELGRLKMDNQYLRSELSTAQRAEALAVFQKRSPSKTVAARVIGSSTGANAKVVFVDRGFTSGVLKGMAVLTPDGIVGKVIASYPTAAQVQLITDPSFAAGVISQSSRVQGTLKGQGRGDLLVDYVQLEQKVEKGEWFFTSGDDRVFPKGLPVGQVSVDKQGTTFREIYLLPSGFQHGLEEVLIVVEGVHQQIPDDVSAFNQPIKLLPPPPPPEGSTDPSSLATPDGGPQPLTTDADRLRQKYRSIGEAQSHKYGEGMTAPNYNQAPAAAVPGTPAGATAVVPGAAPGTTATRAVPPAAGVATKGPTTPGATPPAGTVANPAPPATKAPATKAPVTPTTAPATTPAVKSTTTPTVPPVKPPVP